MFKQKRITKEQALVALAQFEQIPIRAIDVALADAVSVAADLAIYAYDAYMICCARQRNAAILTLDSGLIYAAQRAGVGTLQV